MIAQILFALVVLLFAWHMMKKSSYEVPANCNPTPVDAKIACVTVYPEFPLAGDMVEDGKKKYCCKSA